LRIITAQSPGHIAEIRSLFREYRLFLNADLQFQQFDTELSNLPGKYGPPDGTLLLAVDGASSLGCGAIRRLGPSADRTCEMKRLYVRAQARGSGIGRLIAESLTREARKMGYCTMKLDTLNRLESAIGLYKSMGFVQIEPYCDNPLPDVVFWELDLDAFNSRHDPKVR
jgi:GNAT superfamily N-acetyltransferase